MSRSSETGVLETNDNKYVVDKKDLINLKRILDKLGIHYILDRVSFHSTHSSLTLMKAIHETKVWKVEKDGSVHLDNRFGHSRKYQYKRMIIPNLHQITSQLLSSGTLTNKEKLLLERFK